MFAMNSSNVKNYNGFFAIMNGLQHPSVERLHDTFKGLKPTYVQLFKSFQQLTSREDHYKAYKTKQETTIPPCVPYLDVFLEELSFLESQTPDVGKGGIVNFGKLRRMSRLIRHLVHYQSTPFTEFPTMEPIQELLLNSMLFEDETLQKKSLMIESPSQFNI